MNKTLLDSDPPIQPVNEVRKTTQFLMPNRIDELENLNSGYNVYPTLSLGSGKIFNGYSSLADYIVQQKNVIIDGFIGVFWDKIQLELTQHFADAGLTVNWISTNTLLKPSSEIKKLIQPFLGEEGAVWGNKTNLSLVDFYDDSISNQRRADTDINIVMGVGAALCNWDAPLLYVELPKNELQFRMRAGSITNLGMSGITEPVKMYKQFYFVDWVLLNKHKKQIFQNVSVWVDGQWPETINWCQNKDLVDGLKKMSESVIRVRPWFEPGAWGGQWIKEHINNINKDVVNLAWSFELIVPENGVVFESEGNLLEVSFDTLMMSQSSNILGKHSEKFGEEFPIRFDFLDTFDGGNLSIQCHPKLAYIKEKFGETITQDETYYILDCDDQARVYLGFQENINPEEFRVELEESELNGTEIEIEDFVQSFPARKHDLFLIPNGTVHSAGRGSLVLEISATPYIFTFKMYDWLRLDLEGNPRPINIEHAYQNLDFSRKGNVVNEELISKPVVLLKEENYQLLHLPTHAEHFYDVHRLEFRGTVNVQTDNVCHVLMLVEGQSLILETQDGTKKHFAFAETFVVPAAAASYTLTHVGGGEAKVVKAFLK